MSGKVYRSELNPVDFLSRAAYIHPEKIAVVDGGRWRRISAARTSRLAAYDT